MSGDSLCLIVVELCCNLWWINVKGKRGRYIALYGWPEQTILCFRRETRQRIFGPEISPYPGVERGRKRELAGQRSWQELATGQQRGESAEELAWNHGQMRSTPETVAEKIGSSEEDRVKRCRHSCYFVEFSLVTYASVSPHMHVVLHTPPSALG